MNFGFDLEGTLDAEVAFKEICAGLVIQSHGVYVITAYWSDGEDPILDLEQEAVRQTQLDAIGFLKGRHYTGVVFAPGRTTEEQAAAKKKACHSYDIALMFEDRQVFTDEISKVTRCLLMQPRI